MQKRRKPSKDFRLRTSKSSSNFNALYGKETDQVETRFEKLGIYHNLISK